MCQVVLLPEEFEVFSEAFKDKHHIRWYTVPSSSQHDTLRRTQLVPVVFQQMQEEEEDCRACEVIVKDFSTRRLRVKKAPVCSLLSHSFCSRCKDAKKDKQRLLKRTYQCGACNMTILVPHSRSGMSNSSYIMGHIRLAFTLRVAVQWNFWFLVLLVVHYNI